MSDGGDDNPDSSAVRMHDMAMAFPQPLLQQKVVWNFKL